MLRNILLALLCFQKFMKRIRVSDLSASQVSRLLSDLSTRTKRKFMRTSLEELSIIVAQSVDWNLSFYLSIPRVSRLPYSPSVTALTRFLIEDVSLFMSVYIERLEKMDEALIYVVNDFVKSCCPQTTWQRVRVKNFVEIT